MEYLPINLDEKRGRKFPLFSEISLYFEGVDAAGLPVSALAMRDCFSAEKQVVCDECTPSELPEYACGKPDSGLSGNGNMR